MGALSILVLRYTVQKHEVFNGLFSPNVSGSSGLLLWKAVDCVWFCSPFNSPAKYTDIGHIVQWQTGGIHSLFGKWRTDKQHIGWLLWTAESKIVHWMDKATFQRCLKGPSNVSTLTWLWLSKAVASKFKIKNKKRCAWTNNIQINLPSYKGKTRLSAASALANSPAWLSHLHDWM